MWGRRLGFCGTLYKYESLQGADESLQGADEFIFLEWLILRIRYMFIIKRYDLMIRFKLYYNLTVWLVKFKLYYFKFK